jgi:hypothetical protein
LSKKCRIGTRNKVSDETSGYVGKTAFEMHYVVHLCEVKRAATSYYRNAYVPVQLAKQLQQL